MLQERNLGEIGGVWGRGMQRLVSWALMLGELLAEGRIVVVLGRDRRHTGR